MDSDNFTKLAETILNEKILELPTKKKRYRICEIEFYLYGEGHLDVYTHRHPIQAEYGRFYLHRLKNGTSFKEGTYKCIDYTMGEKGKYFGILIRSIMDMDTKDYFAGPCLSVNALFSNYGTNLKSSDFSAKFNIDEEFRLVDANIERVPLKWGPRIGLNDSTCPEFRHKKYRYVSVDGPVKEKRKLERVPR